MTLRLEKDNAPLAHGPLVFIVLDGVGLGRGDAYDAWAQAETPVLDRLLKDAKRSRSLFAHGTHVGLPTDDDMGNSEVGHNAIGAGRVVKQGASLVDDALADGSLFESPGYAQIRAAYERPGAALHFIGLLSDGGVHSRFDQLEKLLRGAAARGANKLRVHVLTDGRDVPDKSAHIYVQQLEDVLASLRASSVDAAIASGGGRMHVTMDRYESDWSIVERGWKAHVLGEAQAFPSAGAAIEQLRQANPDVSDQYLPPFVVVDDAGAPVGPIVDGDAVVMFNFRGDRMIEICRAFEDEDLAAFDRQRVPDVTFAGMMEYDGDLHIPSRHLVAPPVINRTMGEYLAAEKKLTLALSETHKYGHVTYFWNGNRSGAFDPTLETYEEIPSDPTAFEAAPEMRAAPIADRTIAALASKEFDLIRINIANGDMVGHTGDLAATIRACAFVDAQLGRILDAVEQAGGIFIVTADHGNCDDMALRNKDGSPLRGPDGEVLPRTSHTLAKVPLCIGGPGLSDDAALDTDREDAGLKNLAATTLALMGFVPPADYEPSLVVHKS